MPQTRTVTERSATFGQRLRKRMRGRRCGRRRQREQRPRAAGEFQSGRGRRRRASGVVRARPAVAGVPFRRRRRKTSGTVVEPLFHGDHLLLQDHLLELVGQHAHLEVVVWDRRADLGFGFGEFLLERGLLEFDLRRRCQIAVSGFFVFIFLLKMF